jgi:hypothetical protein
MPGAKLAYEDLVAQHQLLFSRGLLGFTDFTHQHRSPT